MPGCTAYIFLLFVLRPMIKIKEFGKFGRKGRNIRGIPYEE